MYPYVMQENLYPCEVIDAQTAEIGPRDGAPGNPSQTTAEVWIDSPSTPYPVRCRDGTCYCTGRVRTILCGPELRAAVEAGHIVRHGRLVRYRMSALFTDFVHALWAVRLDAKLCGDRVSDGLAKALMNSLYGKFGQRGGSWITEGKDYAPNFFGAGYLYGPRPEDDYESRVIAGVFQVRRKDMLARGTFVPIAAYTTSYARVYMDVIRGIVGEDQVYYQAVDSLLISELGRDRLQARDLVADATLGALRVAGTFAWVDVKALGWLDRPDRALKPGVPGDAVPVTADVFAQDRRQSCAASLRQGKASCVSIRETLTHLRAGYRRGEVLANGRVRPWVISNWHLTPERQRDQPLLHQRDRR